MKTLKWLIVPFALSVSLPALAAPPPGHSGGQLEQKHHAMRSKMLRERVGLSEEKARRVESILDKYAPEKKKSHEAMRAAREKLHQLIESKSTDQAQYRAALDSVRAGNKASQDVMTRAFDEVAKELTPKEQALLFVALQDKHGRGKGSWHGDGRGPGDHHGRGKPGRW